MADILNLANCGTGSNVGKFPCFFNPSIYDRFIMIPKGEVISAATLASAAATRAYIKGRLMDDTPALRWKLSGTLSQLQDNTEARKTENKNGRLFTTQFPPYSWTYDMTLQFGQFAKWRSYNLLAQSLYDFIFIDVNGALIGAEKVDEDDALGLGGVSLYEFVMEDMKQATPDALVKFLVTLGVENNKQLNEGASMVNAGITPADWDQLLIDCLVTQGQANTSTAIKVQLFSDGIGAKSSMLALYGTELDAAAAWIVKKNGSAITPSGVAYDATNDQMVFTISALSSADVVTVQLAAPSVVNASPYFAPLVTEGTIYSYTHP